MANIGVQTSVGSVGPSGTPDLSMGNFFISVQSPWGIDSTYQVVTSMSMYSRLYGGLNKLISVGSPDLWGIETNDAAVQAFYGAKAYFAEKQPGSPGVLYVSRVVASSSGSVAATGTFPDVVGSNNTTATCKMKCSAGNTMTVAWLNPSPRAVFTPGAGTVTTTTSSGAVTGSGTGFVATQVGQGIQIGGINYVIATWVSSTSITVLPIVVTGAAGQAYSTSQPIAQVTVKFPQANITEVRDIATAADAAAYSQKSELLTLTLPAGGQLPVTVAATKLTGGTDGTAAYSASDSDYVGTVSAANVKTGLQVFADQRLGVGYVAIPGKYTAAIRTGINTHCSSYNRRGLFSSPSGLTLATVGADLASFGSNFCSYYTPQIRMLNENDPQGGYLTCDNTGAIAGLGARMIRDYNFGPHKSPAGKLHPFVAVNDIERQSPSGNELYDDGASNTLADSGINTIRLKKGFVVWGNRTLAVDRRYLQINAAQVIDYVVGVGQLILEQYVFEPIDDKLFATVRADFKVLMSDLFSRGSLYGTEPQQNPTKDDAYGIVCDRSNNPDQVVVNNQFKVDVLFVPKPNAESIIFSVSPAAPGFAGRSAQ